MHQGAYGQRRQAHSRQSLRGGRDPGAHGDASQAKDDRDEGQVRNEEGEAGGLEEAVSVLEEGLGYKVMVEGEDASGTG